MYMNQYFQSCYSCQSCGNNKFFDILQNMRTDVCNGDSCCKSDSSVEGTEDPCLRSILKNCTIEMSESSKEKKLSYMIGDTSEPLKTLTIGQLMEQAAQHYPNRVAISFYGGRRLTYAELLEQADTLAMGYLDMGLRRGDHIGIWGFNTVEWYLSYLAAFRAGLVAVNFNPLYEAPEVLGCLRTADVKALIMDEELNDRNFYDVLKKAVPEIEAYDYNSHIATAKLPLLKTVIILSEKSYKGTFKWKDLFKTTNEPKQKIKEIQSQIDAFDVCNILFTSGTTSTSKAVLLTHHNLVNESTFVAKRLRWHEKSHRICVQVPFFHSYGAVNGIIAGVGTASTIVLPSKKFSPNKSIDCIIEEKCTIVYGTPTMYIDLITVSQKRAVTDPQIYDKMSSVERLGTGAAMCLPELIIQLNKLFKNVKFTSGFGMTETSPCTFLSLPDDPVEVILSTVGYLLDHVEVKVVDSNNQIVPLGTTGEICFRGYGVMKGYYKEPEKTREILKEDGWLYTGDKCILFENGYAQVVGRIKETIIRGGENIEPREVEVLIITHPDIIDVQVFGVSDARLGEIVAAAILRVENSTLTEEDVKKYCQGMIASYKIPQIVTFVDEFPKTASGKVQKVKLKEMVENQLNNR